MDGLSKQSFPVLIAVVYLCGLCGVSLGQQSPCSIGQFRLLLTGNCVSECPCGTYGDSNTGKCSNISGEGRFFFNQTHFNSVISASKISTTPVVAATLLIDKKFTENVSSIAISGLIGPSFSGNYDISYLILFFYYHFGTIRMQVSGEERIGDNLVFMIDDFNNASQCSNGTHTYFTTPIKVFAGNFTGPFQISLNAREVATNPVMSQVGSVAVTATVNTLADCDDSADQYLFSTGECVHTCPCGTHPLFGSCQKSQPIQFDNVQHTVTVTPQSTAGMKVAFISIMAEESALKNADSLLILKTNLFVRNNNSNNNNSGQSFVRLPTVTPTLAFGLSNSTVRPSASTNSFLIFTKSAIADLIAASQVSCIIDSTKYINIPFELRLLSESFFHLGDHVIAINGILLGNNTFREFPTFISLKVDAECENELQLYDFTTHECVSRCPCGYAPFRSHSTSYCEAVDYHPAEFLDDKLTIQTVPNSVTTTSISLYVNLDSYFFDEILFGNMYTIVARLQVEPILMDSADDAWPVLTFAQPNRQDRASLEVTLNSTSLTNLSFCYDQFQSINHTIYNVSINIRSPEQSDRLGVYHFAINLSLYSPENDIVTRFLADNSDSYTLTVNVTQNGSTHDITSIQATSLPTSVVSRNAASPLVIGVSTGIAGGMLLLVGLPVLIVVILISVRFYRRKQVTYFKEFTNDETSFGDPTVMTQSDCQQNVPEHAPIYKEKPTAIELTQLVDNEIGVFSNEN